MDIGASIFFTEYSISPGELGSALEERGFDSLWVAEHTRIPVVRRFNVPTGGELERQYYDVMDPFVTLSAAAAATKRLKLATGVCLVIQRDTIQTAKLVASLDQVSGGRFIFGIGGGWNAEEMENHGTVYETRFQKMREQIEAMKAIWTMDKAEYHGELVDFPPMMTMLKPVQKPHPAIIVGGAFRFAARRAEVWRRHQPAGFQRRVRRTGGICAALPADGARGWPRSQVFAGDLGRRPGRSRSPKAVPGSWRGTDECPLAAGQSGRDPAHAGPLGEIDPAAPLDRTPRYAQNRAVRRPQRL
jgi:probable F420-dependent oxidoreductase